MLTSSQPWQEVFPQVRRERVCRGRGGGGRGIRGRRRARAHAPSHSLFRQASPVVPIQEDGRERRGGRRGRDRCRGHVHVGRTGDAPDAAEVECGPCQDPGGAQVCARVAARHPTDDALDQQACSRAPDEGEVWAEEPVRRLAAHQGGGIVVVGPEATGRKPGRRSYEADARLGRARNGGGCLAVSAGRYGITFIMASSAELCTTTAPRTLVCCVGCDSRPWDFWMSLFSLSTFHCSPSLLYSANSWHAMVRSWRLVGRVCIRDIGQIECRYEIGHHRLPRQVSTPCVVCLTRPGALPDERVRDVM